MGTDDVAGQQRRERNRWWLWCAGGFVLSLGLLLVLGQWFPVSAGVPGVWLVLAISTSAHPQAAPRAGNRPATIFAFVLVATGLSLLIGALIPNRDDGELRVEGTVLGVAITAVGSIWAALVAKRSSRRQVDAEIERFRREQAAAPEDRQ
ncbi:hypothetical protein [Curtobacterium sp. PhB146]|uniref:hypothetical protein n=1 Tax=Curtobacterium sp. PhB146 TaxID=2485187 RepID=UPI00104AA001|nr:hypothetical protein [Curtobacterium sp. PhB146]TCU44457.1 hypothetical protein EDF33_1066 [Curtobacterium sp. PhB146]